MEGPTFFILIEIMIKNIFPDVLKLTTSVYVVCGLKFFAKFGNWERRG